MKVVLSPRMIVIHLSEDKQWALLELTKRVDRHQEGKQSECVCVEQDEPEYE